MPVSQPYIHRAGVGPLLLRDTFILELPNLPELSSFFWIFITIISLLCGAFLLAFIVIKAMLLLKSLKDGQLSDKRIFGLFFSFCAIIYLSLICCMEIMDRYMVLPAALILLDLILLIDISKIKPINFFLADVILIFSFGLFSITTTHDYLAWNRSRWLALNDLLAENISRFSIDGGPEFNELNCWISMFRSYHDRNINPDLDPDFLHIQRGEKLKKEKSWWCVNDDTYMISFGEVPGYTPIRRYEFIRWLPPMKGNILVLKRQFNAI